MSSSGFFRIETSEQLRIFMSSPGFFSTYKLKLLNKFKPFGKPLHQSNSDSSHGILGFHTNKPMLHTPPCSTVR